MNLRELALQEAKLTLRLNSIKQELNAVREATQTALERAEEENGTRQISVTLHGARLATIGLNEDSRKAEITDEEAFKAWVSQNHPDEIKRQFISEVRPAFSARLLAEMTKSHTAHVVDTTSGELREVPGVEIRTTRRRGHALRFKNDDARKALRAAG